MKLCTDLHSSSNYYITLLFCIFWSCYTLHMASLCRVTSLCWYLPFLLFRCCRVWFQRASNALDQQQQENGYLGCFQYFSSINISIMVLKNPKVGVDLLGCIWRASVNLPSSSAMWGSILHTLGIRRSIFRSFDGHKMLSSILICQWGWNSYV